MRVSPPGLIADLESLAIRFGYISLYGTKIYKCSKCGIVKVEEERLNKNPEKLQTIEED